MIDRLTRDEPTHHAPSVFVTCTECFGEGAIETPQPFYDDPYYCRVDRCSACDGVGGWVEEYHSRWAVEMEDMP